MSKKERSDSAHKASEIASLALRKYEPPAESKLRDCHMVYWDKIIKARHEWSEVDLLIASNLAIAFHDLTEYRIRLEQEGPTVMGGRHGNTPIINPMFAVVETTTRRITNLSQKLQVHAQATMGDPRNSKAKNKVKAEFLDAFADEDDDLIARPH